MTTTTARKTEKTKMEATADPRLTSFLAPNGPEIFHSVATPTSLWRPDPFDIDSIQRASREAFTRLLVRASGEPVPLSGAILVLLGDAGSGKTHLMRAFRNQAHTGGNGYCGYMQMTTEVSNYDRYILTNLISDLEKPYTPESQRTALNRLSTTLLESVPGLTAEQREKFREDEGDAVTLVDEYADRLQELEQFRECSLELLRVMLHLERDDTRVRSRALMWLRCQNMKASDRKWIGDAEPLTDDASPNLMIRHLAGLMRAMHHAPLVLLVDQLEDMAKQSAPVERFQKIIDAITALADQNSNVVVVMACLEDYFGLHEDKINLSKKQRLMNDPAPIKMRVNCDVDDIRAMISVRLNYLYEKAGVDVDADRSLFPFEEKHVAQLAGLPPRMVLLNFLRHHQRCIAAGHWIEPWDKPIKPDPKPDTLSKLWNDFENSFVADVPDEEPEFADTLARAIAYISAELPEGNHYGTPKADGRFIELELALPDNTVVKTLLAFCNKSPKGGGLGNQLDEVAKRAGENAATILRTTAFPKSGANLERISALGKTIGCRAVIENSDWRAMQAFAEFYKQNGSRGDFAAWQREIKPLGSLEPLRKILRLDSLKTAPRTLPAEQPPETEKLEAVATAPSPAKVAPKQKEELPTPPELAKVENTKQLEPLKPVELSNAIVPIAPKSGIINGGNTTGISQKSVTFKSIEFTRHAAFLGGAGSGKTTAALNIIEQLLAKGIPVVLVDRKGDLSQYAQDEAWNRPLSADREAARAKLRDMTDVAVYTPGAPTGRPLALPVVPPGFELLGEFERESFAKYAANALAAMMKLKASDADQAQRVILAKAIETLASVPNGTVNVPHLRELIAESDPSLMAALAGGYKPKYFEQLAERLNTLHLSYKHLFQGSESLDVGSLLQSEPGRVKLSILCTRFLGDATDFWVAQFLIAVARFCAKQPKPHLQAVLMFDEADKYLPAIGKPATKEPMEDLLKRARSAGVGVFLATQSPGDLDYKCRENLLTWFVGRVGQDTAIDKLKPLLASKPGATDKLGGQVAGQFHLVREGGVVEMKSFESLIKTEQLSEAEILALARRGA